METSDGCPMLSNVCMDREYDKIPPTILAVCMGRKMTSRIVQAVRFVKMTQGA